MYRAKALGMVLTGVRIQKALGCRYSDGFPEPDCFVPRCGHILGCLGRAIALL